MGYREYLQTPTEPDSRFSRFLQSPATWTIFAINTAVFLAAEITGDTTTNETLIRFGACNRHLIWAGEYWRWATSVFLHIGWIHFLWNSYVMFGWCREVERALGTPKFAAAYLLSGIGASAVSSLAHDVLSAGASGSGFAMLGVFLILSYRRIGTWDAFIQDPHVRNILVMAGLWFGIGFIGAINMDNYAHAGGLAFGLIVGWAMTGEYESTPEKALTYGVAVLIFIATLGLAARPWFGQDTAPLRFGLFEEANSAILRGEYREALRLYDEAERSGIQANEIDYNRAIAHWRLGETSEALRWMQRAYSRGRHDVLTSFNIGTLHMELKDHRGALEWLHRAEALQPDRSIYQALEECYRRLGDEAKAEEYRRKVK
jgi:rhomboid protease GluP